MKSFAKYAAIAAIFVCGCARAVEFESVFGKGDINLPSFSYGGKAFDSSRWKRETKPLSDGADATETLESFLSPDGRLLVEQRVIRYKKYPFVEWKTVLKNVSAEKSDFVDDIRTFRIDLPNKPNKVRSDGVSIRRLNGAGTSVTDFVEDVFFLERRPSAEKMTMSNSIGYASDNWMPYFGIDFTPFCGLNVAIGWCGNWRADFQITKSDFTVDAGMFKSHFRLNPGEALMQPSVLVMYRKGMRIADAQNVWRRFILEYKTPKDESGGPFITPIQTGTGGNFPTQKLVGIAKTIKRCDLPVKLFGIDAGWYGGRHIPKPPSSMFGDWGPKAGDWRMNTAVHPNGLKPLSDAARDAGMNFSLWLEIERVMPGTPIWNEHPEFLMKSGPDASKAVLNLGNPMAWRLAFDILCKAIEENGVDVWRIDSNLGPALGLAFDSLDAENPDRVGLANAKHVEGLYRLWDELKKKYPKMQFDNCAGGGKRLDYESLSRTFTVWRSDTQCWRNDEVAEASQVQTFYLQSWLPSSSGGNGANIDDEYKYVSSFSSGFMISAHAFGLEKNLPIIKRYVGLASRIRKYITCDFYRLTQNPENHENWCAYQGHSPAEDAGFFIAFRRNDSPAAKQFLSLSGIDQEAAYSLEDKYGNVSEVKGSRLQEFIVELPPRDYALYFYKKIK